MICLSESMILKPFFIITLLASLALKPFKTFNRFASFELCKPSRCNRISASNYNSCRAAVNGWTELLT
jgi:hypothetical protein